MAAGGVQTKVLEVKLPRPPPGPLKEESGREPPIPTSPALQRGGNFGTGSDSQV